MSNSERRVSSQGIDSLGIARHNLDYIELLYAAWADNPESIDSEWAARFAAEEFDSEALPRPSFSPKSIFNGGEGASVGTPKSDNFVLGSDQKVSFEERTGFLQQLAIFSELSEADVAELGKAAEELICHKGDYLMREGEPGDALFVIASGEVLISRNEQVLARLGVGEVIGEMSILDSERRSADAIAHSDVRLLRLSTDTLRNLLETRTSLARGLIKVLVRRLRDSSSKQDRVDQLIRAYRVRGHLIARLDPLGRDAGHFPELDPGYYGLTDEDLDLVFSSSTIPGHRAMKLRDILDHLRATYCGSVAVQYMHIDDIHVKKWLQNRMESTQNTMTLSREEQIRILTKLTDAEIFEQFIHKKFIGAKRFSLEGAESLIPLLDMAVEVAGHAGVREIVIGMAHRGRLNVLANILGKSPQQIFREFNDDNPDLLLGRGDVKYHLGFSADHETKFGEKVHLSLTFNPSHLEFVNPVVLGRVRSKQDRQGAPRGSAGMAILIHGDASFAGQGVVQETLNLSQLPGYQTGGTLHIIVNNQIGFTTLPQEGRSTQYATDVAKMLQIPILHVNGEHPEAVAHAIYLAMDFRTRFHRDVVIDMYCYRRFGHNEGDEPSFTQPVMYDTIRKRSSVRESYVENLVRFGEISSQQAEQIAVARRDALERHLSDARSSETKVVGFSTGEGYWRGYIGGVEEQIPDAQTSLPKEELVETLKALALLPSGFTPNPKFSRFLKAREEMWHGQRLLDWSAGEALAIASLIRHGYRVRMTGQDAQRGTFSHRHSVLHDVTTGATHNVFSSVGGANFEVHNSPLSEVGVLGFEYGYSLDSPSSLVIWEAQFGDFANVAQPIIDQFITSGEDKWSRLSGLVMLLPHGFEGQGPEHSSARLERFLVAAAEDNIQVVNLSTPAQLFHCLRRQVLRPLRKPLIVMSPKSLLRHPNAVSSFEELSEGTFQRLIADSSDKVQPSAVRKILLTTGKLYYELEAARQSLEAWDVAIIRLEQLYPIRDAEMKAMLERYPEGTPVVWVQEEPHNMGAWGYLVTRYGHELFEKYPFSCVSRAPSASPATGSASAHKKEQGRIITNAFERNEVAGRVG